MKNNDMVRVTPEMLHAAQTKSEIGAFVTANWVGAYDTLTQLYQVMHAAQPAEQSQAEKVEAQHWLEPFNFDIRRLTFPAGCYVDISDASKGVLHVRNFEANHPAEQHQGEPVAWRFQTNAGGRLYLTHFEANARAYEGNGEGGAVEPLFANPGVADSCAVCRGTGVLPGLSVNTTKCSYCENGWRTIAKAEAELRLADQKERDILRAQLATETSRADAAVGDANDAERKLAERDALLRLARQFVVNGVDLGYIQMPDADTPDPAHDLVPKIDAALSGSAEPSAPECKGWTCFHCDEHFTDAEAAAIHFGTHEIQRPACLIDAAEYRSMEARVRECANEDSELHRQISRLASNHKLELQRAEESGYAKGIAETSAPVERDVKATLRSLLEGVEVSIDVSTCDEDAGNRLFGTVSEVMDHPPGKHGVMLLVHDQEPNFKPVERDERAAFEKAAEVISLRILGRFVPARNADGSYRNQTTQLMHDVWQARAALERKPSDDIPDFTPGNGNKAERRATALVAQLQADLTARDEKLDQTQDLLRYMVYDYRSVVQAGYDRITALGSDCDSVAKMLADNPNYQKALALLLPDLESRPEERGSPETEPCSGCGTPGYTAACEKCIPY